MRWLPRRRPRPPQGVELVYRNGERIACEVDYIGVVEGMHIWEISTTADLEGLVRVHVAVLPAKTSLRFFR